MKRLQAPAIVVGAIAVGALAWFPLRNTDIWWHLAAGDRILDTGWLFADPFSSGSLGERWVDIHWLFQVGASAVFHSGGVGAIVLAKVVLLVAAWFGLLLACRVAGARLFVAVPLSLLALLAVRHLLLARPVIASLLLLSAVLGVLERYRVTGRWPVLLWLLPLQIIWANTQGLHPLGPILVGVWWLGRGLDRLRGRGVGGWAVSARTGGFILGATMVATLIVSLINPYGLDALALPWRLFARIEPSVIDGANVYATSVAENLPPHFLARHGAPVWHLPIALLVVAAAIVAGRGQLSAAHLGMTVVLFALALTANRNLLLAYWLTPPVAALGFTAVLDRWGTGRFAFRYAPHAGVATVGLLAVASLALAAREPSTERPGPFSTPEPVSSVLAELPAGNVFASVRYGSYLTWKTAPRHRPYFDGRLILRSRAAFAEYLDAVDRPEVFTLLAGREGFRYALLPVDAPDRYQTLVRALYRSASWQLVATDGTAVLFAWDQPRPGLDLSDEAAVAPIVSGIDARWEQHPRVRRAAVTNLGRLLTLVGEPEQALRVLESVDGPDAGAVRAAANYAAGRLDDAEREALRALAAARGRDQDEVRQKSLLALIALQRGRREEALGWLRQALTLSPWHPQSRALLEQLEAEGDERAE